MFENRPPPVGGPPPNYLPAQYSSSGRRSRGREFGRESSRRGRSPLRYQSYAMSTLILPLRHFAEYVVIVKLQTAI